MKHRAFWTRFFLAASILTAGLIFFFSTQQGPESAAMSGEVTRFVARLIRPGYETLDPTAREAFLESLGLIVRKCAHFSEFALLGFNLTGWLRLKRWEKPRLSSAARAWPVAARYAGTDELHQMIVSGRAPALLDVGIDVSGALMGTLAALCAMVLIARQARKPSPEGELWENERRPSRPG